MPALLMRRSRRPNFSAAPLTKSRHAASLPTSACVKPTLAPAVSSSAATRRPRSPSRSQNCHTRPLGDETPDRRLADPRCPAGHRCDLALEPSHVRHLSLHSKTLIHDTSYPSGRHPLVGRAGAFELNRLRNETAPLVVWRRHGLVGSRRGLEFLANGL